MKSQKLGFTLIELLIVISLLGVLAVGLLATIDPFEQLKKGRDTSTRNMLEEFYNAGLRYYAIKDSFPWGGSTLTGEALTAASMGSYLSAIVGSGELKQAYTAASGLDKIFITSTTGSATKVAEDLTVCFQPQSKAFRNDNNSKYNISGGGITDTAICPNPTSATCYWCIK